MSDDKFYKEIADKLSDYEMPVSDSVWDAIATSIDSASKKKSKSRVIYFLPFVGAAIAASIVAFVLLGRKADMGVNPYSTEPLVAETTVKDEPIQVVESFSSSESMLLSDNITPKRRSAYVPVNVFVEDEKEEYVDYSEKSVTEDQIDDNQNVIVSENFSVKGNDTNEEVVVPAKDNKDVIDYWASVEAEERYNERSSYQPQLTTGLYTASSGAAPKFDIFESGDYAYYDDALASGSGSGIYASNTLNGFTPKEVYHSKHHNQPIRLGIAVGYKFTPELSLESGLVWSSLHSVFQETWTKQEYSQMLQYVGVPFSLVWTFYQGEKLGFYVSGGTMLEKCISAKFGPTKIDQHPWQWSLMDAVGAQYGFSKNIGLFVEPGLAYYFKDGSSIESVYKENPTVVSLKLGLRISLL